jgi:hypothetical protein
LATLRVPTDAEFATAGLDYDGDSPPAE